MKMISLIFILTVFTRLVPAQEIGFIPPMLPGVSEESYNKGKYILENTYKSIKENGDTVYADYWNMAVGLSHLGYDKNKIMELFRKSKSMNTESFCKIINYGKNDFRSGKISKMLGEEFQLLIADCNDSGKTEIKPVAPEKMTNEKELNNDLIIILDAMIEKDQKYRRDKDLLNNTAKWARQKELDLENRQQLEIIFKKYGCPGKSVVGKEHANYAALILEHADDLSFQEKWLPLIIEAMKKEEVSKNIVRLLIDRIYLKKTGRQIFGSQHGVPMEAEEIIRKIQLKYGL